MERTLLYHCRMACPARGLIEPDALLSFHHISEEYPPDPIGYAGPRTASGAPDYAHPVEGDAALDMEGMTILPGFIDLDASLVPLDSPSPESAALEAYRRSAKALYRGITTVGYPEDTPVIRALSSVSSAYYLWTPALVPCKTAPPGYRVLYGAPGKGTQAEREYLARVRDAVSAGMKPAVSTGLPADVPVDGYMPLVRCALLLCQGGYSPMEALAAVTCHNAAVLGVSDVTGTLVPGLAGDIVAVAGEPEKDLAALSQIVLSARGGRLINSALPGFQRNRFAVVPPGCHF